MYDKSSVHSTHGLGSAAVLGRRQSSSNKPRHRRQIGHAAAAAAPRLRRALLLLAIIILVVGDGIILSDVSDSRHGDEGHSGSAARRVLLSHCSERCALQRRMSAHFVLLYRFFRLQDMVAMYGRILG